MLPIIVIPVGIAAVAVAHKRGLLARPSTYMRVAEDAAIAVPKNIAERAKRFVRRTKIEYQARSINKLQEIIATEARTLRTMSEAQRKQLAADQQDVFSRAEELRREREAKSEARGYYARRARAERIVGSASNDEA